MIRDDYEVKLPWKNWNNKRYRKYGSTYPTVDEIDEFNAVLHGAILHQAQTGQAHWLGYEVERFTSNELPIDLSRHHISQREKRELELSKLPHSHLDNARIYFIKNEERLSKIRAKIASKEQLTKNKNARIIPRNPLGFRHQGSFILLSQLVREGYKDIHKKIRTVADLFHISNDEAIRKIAWKKWTGQGEPC